MRIKPLSALYVLLFVAAAGVAAYVATFNTDGSSYVKDTYSQFDELIAVGEVNAILTPGDLKHFVFYVISGFTLMYGRGVFVLDAVVSYIPYCLWGLTGQVIATRITHALCMLLALYILLQTFIRNPWLKIATAFILIVSPYTLYYTMVPKPEPFQLLCIALFLYYFKRSQWQFGWHFIWLGIGFGSKISLLPALPFLFALPVLFRHNTFVFNLEWKPLMKSILWFLGGFILCIPCLLLAPVKPIFARSYVHQTFGSATQDDDDPNLNWADWTQYLFARHYHVYTIVLIGVAVLLCGIFLYLLVKRRLQTDQWLPALLGLILIGTIFVFTKRLWPHYLYVGLALLWTGLMAAIAQLTSRIGAPVTAIIIIAIFSFQALAWGKEIRTIATREKDPLYQQVKENSLRAYRYAEKQIGPRLIADASMFLPYNLHVRGKRYEPFPALKDSASLYLESINNLGPVLYTSDYDAILFAMYNPETYKPGPNDFPDRKQALITMKQYVPALYHRDTAFGNIVIYRKN